MKTAEINFRRYETSQGVKYIIVYDNEGNILAQMKKDAPNKYITIPSIRYWILIKHIHKHFDVMYNSFEEDVLPFK